MLCVLQYQPRSANAAKAMGNWEKKSQYLEQLAAVPEFATYGDVLNSSNTPTSLTEAETEYQVTCVKHIFKEHIVFQVRPEKTRALWRK